ncbi:L,D-transpeptidase [Terrarubrum flagellatum]|uniref:L,D-transpeptidase n=1 Tax=Terrirubrum flagellatum TaxID=2895980 RepID=UPI003144DA4D
MKHPILMAALLAATSAPALSISSEAQTFGQSSEAITGTVGPRASRPTPYAQNVMRTANNLGGGFIEMLVTGRDPTSRGADNYVYAPEPQRRGYLQNMYASVPPQQVEQRPVRKEIDPRFLKQEVAYSGPHRPGTIVIDTPNKFLYLVQSGGTAIRYGIGVGRPGFAWAGTKSITRKAEWPSWTPPAEMLKRRPDLPRFMAGGIENPLGARAMYLGSSLYRIHGTNEPETIGESVSSGCIRMTNENVVDLYNRVRVGTTVIVM